MRYDEDGPRPCTVAIWRGRVQTLHGYGMIEQRTTWPNLRNLAPKQPTTTLLVPHTGYEWRWVVWKVTVIGDGRKNSQVSYYSSMVRFIDQGMYICMVTLKWEVDIIFVGGHGFPQPQKAVFPVLVGYHVYPNNRPSILLTFMLS